MCFTLLDGFLNILVRVHVKVEELSHACHYIIILSFCFILLSFDVIQPHSNAITSFECHSFIPMSLHHSIVILLYLTYSFFHFSHSSVIPSLYHYSYVIQSFLAHSGIISSSLCHSIIPVHSIIIWCHSNLIPMPFHHLNVIPSLQCHSIILLAFYHSWLIPSFILESFQCHSSHSWVIQSFLHHSIIPISFHIIPISFWPHSLRPPWPCHKVWRKVVHPEVRLG